MGFPWKLILRAIAILTIFIAVGWVIVQPGFEPILAALGAVVALITSFFVEDMSLHRAHLPADVTLYDVNCGRKGIDLANQRLRVTAAFGSYFTGLLEREQSYIPLSGQIDCPIPKGQEELPPMQRIFWALQNPKGTRVFILAADGGMGKSTLASKLVRCLYDQEAIDLILGDSAKGEQLDPVSGKISELSPGYRSLSGFYRRLCMQLGMPYQSDELALKDIRRRLVNRHAVIVVDNLETVAHGDRLLQALMQMTTRDIRAIVTTRQVTGLDALGAQHMVVHLNSLQDEEAVGEFVRWHIDQFEHTHRALARLRSDTGDKKWMKWLIGRSGGIPLLMQLLISDVARSSWDHMSQRPTMFGVDQLNFLYEARWRELGTLGRAGLLAREILVWLRQEQFTGKRATSKRLAEWAQAKGASDFLTDALSLLHERFLIVNSDPRKGSYAIFPSLSEFLLNIGIGSIDGL